MNILYELCFLLIQQLLLSNKINGNLIELSHKVEEGAKNGFRPKIPEVYEINRIVYTQNRFQVHLPPVK